MHHRKSTMNDQRSTSPHPRPAVPRAESELARLAKALGHPARIEILKMLIELGDCQCGAIVDRLPLAQATVSQHLKVLKEAGLIRGEIDPPRVCYCVNPQAVARLKALIAGL
jgi:ArsR family transcriptional regulator